MNIAALWSQQTYVDLRQTVQTTGAVLWSQKTYVNLGQTIMGAAEQTAKATDLALKMVENVATQATERALKTTETALQATEKAITVADEFLSDSVMQAQQSALKIFAKGRVPIQIQPDSSLEDFERYVGIDHRSKLPSKEELMSDEEAEKFARELDLCGYYEKTLKPNPFALHKHADDVELVLGSKKEFLEIENTEKKDVEALDPELFELLVECDKHLKGLEELDANVKKLSCQIEKQRIVHYSIVKEAWDYFFTQFIQFLAWVKST